MQLTDVDLNSTCVVGSAGILLDSRMGDNIDSFHNVVRFNNVKVPSEMRHDIGSKFNIWSTSFYRDIDDRSDFFEHIVCPFPLNNGAYDERYYRNKELIAKFTPEFIPTKIFESLLEHVDNPSTGIATLFWLYKIGMRVSPDNVFGFSFFKGLHHYYDDFRRCGHDGDMEQALFHKMIRGEA